MRNYAEETERRVQFIRQAVADAHADGILFGNSGGKDSALVGILCKMACENTEGIILPCSSKRNFTIDKDDGMEVAEQFGIKTRVIDLTAQKELAIETMSQVATLSQAAIGNLAPRLRMLTLYAIGASENRLVAGTGNASEYHMGYFTKWGDGAYDLNPIADLTATEVFEFLRYLKAPQAVITKAPSAGLFEGQTDEEDMGVTYAAIDKYITTGEANEHDKAIIDRYHAQRPQAAGPIAVSWGMNAKSAVLRRRIFVQTTREEAYETFCMRRMRETMAEAVVDILTYHNYLVETVADGAEALAYAQNGDYDGIILDVMMPKMDGLGFLAAFERWDAVPLFYC